MDELISSQQIAQQASRSRSAVSQARYRYRWVALFRAVYLANAGLPGRTPKDFIRAAQKANAAGRPRELIWDK